MDAEELRKLKQAGKIASEAREYAKKFLKAGTPLIDIANEVEAKIVELGGRPSFPVCTSINELAAHCSYWDDKVKLKQGDLVKIDIGSHIDGWIADCAFSFSIGKDEENEILIKATENALKAAIKLAVPGTEVREIGRAVNDEMEKLGVNPIKNLTGHLIQRYELHSNISIPSFDNNDRTKLKEDMVIAIEPFATKGTGLVSEIKDFHIFRYVGRGNLRTSREVLQYVINEYKTLPFSRKWILKKFGPLNANLFLRQGVTNGILESYGPLKVTSNNKAAQTEHTIIVKEKPIITTK